MPTLISRLRRRRRRGEPGAALIEFAILMPLLVLLLLGMLEFGWALAQQIDVRSKAREGLRMAVVDEPLLDIEARVCANDIVKGTDINFMTITSGIDTGSAATFTVEADLRQITGLFGIFWGSNPTITSTVEGRVEQASSFGSPEELAPCP